MGTCCLVAVAVVVLVLVALIGCAWLAFGGLRLWRTAGTSRRPVLRRVLAGVALLIGAYLLLLGAAVWLTPALVRELYG